MFYGPAGLREVLVWLWLGLVWLPLAEGVEMAREWLASRRWKRWARGRNRAAWKRLANRSERRNGVTTGSFLGRRRRRPSIQRGER